MDAGCRDRTIVVIRHARWRATVILLLFVTLLSVGVAELTARVFWRLGYGPSFGGYIPLRHPSLVLYSYYPKLRQVDEAAPSRADDFFDVLILGGSAFHREWGQVEQELGEQLASSGVRNVRIFNLAVPAHTSRDSFLKYAALGEARFELVIVYDGFNEVRANNAPPEIFREDYGHYSWYEIANAFAPYHRTASFALPYSLRYLALRTKQVLRKDRYLGTHLPREDWLPYGAVPRSATSFSHNLEKIIGLASERGDRVLLMTTASYVPADYSLIAFKEKRLDYGFRALSQTPIEIWGRREHVVATIAAHNEVVRGLARRYKGVLFVDQANLMTGSGQFFNDPCHFTAAGSSKFVENLIGAVVPSRKPTVQTN